MKNADQCIEWCEHFLSGDFGVKPNVEDANYFRSIIALLKEQTQELKRRDETLELFIDGVPFEEYMTGVRGKVQ